MQYKLMGIRKEHQDNQEDIAKLLGINVQTYRKKEHDVSQFNLQEMFKIADRYNMRVDDIFLPRKFTIRGQRQKSIERKI